MNIKSLLLGSAAALVAVSGARAADAVVIAEPEPVEYVRVCDAYGAGFFYIPGTETCLRIGGEVRYQIGSSNDDDAINAIRAYRGGAIGSDTPGIHGHVADTWNKEARGRFFLDARSDTEWGTLRGYIRVDASRGGFAVANNANNIRTNKAFVELGGLKMGFEDSAWAFTPNSGVAVYGSHSDTGLAYGYQQRNLVQYNFVGGNGFFATVSLEDDVMNNVAAVAAAAPLIAVPAYTNNNYMPDVVVRAGVNQGWGAVWAAVGYDEDRTNGATTAGVAGAVFPAAGQLGDDGWAGQLGLHINVPNAPGSSFKLIGLYADSDNAYNGHGGEFSVIASYYHQFTSTFGASIGAQYINDRYLPGSDISTGADQWLAELNVVWTPVRDFAVRTELVYSDIGNSALGNPDGTLSGFIRFSRFF